VNQRTSKEIPERALVIGSKPRLDYGHRRIRCVSKHRVTSSRHPSECRPGINRNRGPASPESAPVTKSLSWPCLLKEPWYFFLKLDNPVLVERFRPCWFQLWMRFQHPLQYRLLVAFEIYKQDMFIVFYSLFKTGEVVVGSLDTKQSTLPRAKTECHHGKEDKRYPAGSGLRPASKMGDSKDQRESANTDCGANQS
jgi:hypothetical protein